MPQTGRCLCGAVTVTAEPMERLQACHCHMCRTWSGGPFLSVPCKEVTFEGPVTRYASSKFAERGFCATCGTHLFFHATGPDIYGLPAGLFADQSAFPFKAEFYIDEKPDNYAFANETRTLTGAEFEARFRSS